MPTPGDRDLAKVIAERAEETAGEVHGITGASIVISASTRPGEGNKPVIVIHDYRVTSGDAEIISEVIEDE